MTVSCKLCGYDHFGNHHFVEKLRPMGHRLRWTQDGKRKTMLTSNAAIESGGVWDSVPITVRVWFKTPEQEQ